MEMSRLTCLGIEDVDEEEEQLKSFIFPGMFHTHIHVDKLSSLTVKFVFD